MRQILIKRLLKTIEIQGFSSWTKTRIGKKKKKYFFYLLKDLVD